MSSVCPEHKFQLQLLSLEKYNRDNDTPPRKLLTQRATVYDGGHYDYDSDDDSGDPYASDEFRMYEFKVRLCMRSRSHDWTDCPFQHPGEKARRRDPRRYHYSGSVCPEFRRGNCSRGDACEFSHGVFESWLHPDRYRTEACKDGKNCKRKVCFFAHTPRQLRVLPLDNDNNIRNQKCSIMTPHSNNNNNHGCLFCQCSSSTCSPTSTLFGVSHFSPTLSPSSPSSPTRFETDDPHESVVKDVLYDIVSSMDGLNFGEASPVSASKPRNLSWLNVSELDVSENQQQFIFSPTITAGGRFSNNGNGRYLREESGVVADDVIAPDLAWVNDLLR
ncbi:zinc finger CCCH domain-containing protein 61 [Cajanus cajan]|uniref:Zinc finger CCCH domain-containing protein 2 n=1 Tax=Cajanus cajan TaxID=3821 RepID=A0A151SVJ4_CAJCA|nr:zinc finger CCCH domain-containing protein 61 [Cajanus cajan]KYP58806.1 Zinc finger CCCH domain-containing protein 2 [Cajanus cajan]